jgi:hypothetical protein
MIVFNQDCTTCALGGGDHTQAKHDASVRWTQALARELEIGRKAPSARPSQILPRARTGIGIFGGV